MTLITKRRLVASPALALVALVVFAGLASAGTPGTWTAYPGQSAGESEATVQQPINTDGSSNFKANGKAVIPVKFALSTGYRPVRVRVDRLRLEHRERLLVRVVHAGGDPHAR